MKINLYVLASLVCVNSQIFHGEIQKVVQCVEKYFSILFCSIHDQIYSFNLTPPLKSFVCRQKSKYINSILSTIMKKLSNTGLVKIK